MKADLTSGPPEFFCVLAFGFIKCNLSYVTKCKESKRENSIYNLKGEFGLFQDPANYQTITFIFF